MAATASETQKKCISNIDEFITELERISDIKGADDAQIKKRELKNLSFSLMVNINSVDITLHAVSGSFTLSLLDFDKMPNKRIIEFIMTTVVQIDLNAHISFAKHKHATQYICHLSINANNLGLYLHNFFIPLGNYLEQTKASQEAFAPLYPSLHSPTVSSPQQNTWWDQISRSRPTTQSHVSSSSHYPPPPASGYPQVPTTHNSFWSPPPPSAPSLSQVAPQVVTQERRFVIIKFVAPDRSDSWYPPIPQDTTPATQKENTITCSIVNSTAYFRCIGPTGEDIKGTVEVPQGGRTLTEDQKEKIYNIAQGKYGAESQNTSVSLKKRLQDYLGSLFLSDYKKDAATLLLNYIQSNGQQSALSNIQHGHFNALTEGDRLPAIYADVKKLFPQLESDIQANLPSRRPRHF